MTQRVHASSAPLAGAGVRLGRIAGIEMVAHWSLLIIFALIAVSLGGAVFPQWHPDWSAGLVWTMALCAALLFFVSVALHELSHAIVGRRQGVPVSRITLFVFGGLAQTSAEPRSPRAELLMAGVGPLTSLLIGVVASTIGWAMVDAAATTPEAVIASAGPMATLLLWLGPINILLALFNMVPGFPLDGGRVLRALLWWITGNMRKATRWAASAGQAFGWLLIGAGVLMALGVYIPVFGVGLVPGLWLVLIGWFLINAARVGYAQVAVRETLADVSVRAIMRSRLDVVPEDLPLDRLVTEYFMTSAQRSFPVVRDGRPAGLVRMEDVRRVPQARWSDTVTGRIMAPLSDDAIMRPGDPALEALHRLSRPDVDEISVVDADHILGAVGREDIAKWMMLRTGEVV